MTAVPMRLEVVVLPVADVDRSRAFYEGLGWRFDGEGAGEGGYRIVQLTPPGSGASIILGSRITSAQPGSVDRLVLAVDDMDEAVAHLASRGVSVDGPFHHRDGGLDAGFHGEEDGVRVEGKDPDSRSYATYAAFQDPDGNRWLLQEITERLPGRV